MTQEQLDNLNAGDRIYNIGTRLKDGVPCKVVASAIVYHFAYHGTDKRPSLNGAWYSYPVAYIDRSNTGHNGRYAFTHTELLRDGWTVESDLEDAIERTKAREGLSNG